jgi:twitching motility protein PilT
VSGTTEPAREDAGAPAAGPTPLEPLLRKMLEAGASDLHMFIGRPPLLRVRGELVPMEGEPELTPQSNAHILTSILKDEQKTTLRESLDLDCAWELPDGSARFRVNVLWQNRGLGGVLRVIPTKILTIDDLSLPPITRTIADSERGLVLVTGPTGSGKSTTLAAMIDYINETREAHIITIEDPLEFVHPNKKCLITQREVGAHTRSFASALRMASREDPDIVLVGEMRDLETVAIAIETAETGHLVFGTLHTTSAVSTVDRIIDQFPADQQEQIRMMLSESLKAVISQVLCKKIGGGRVAALEVLVVNSAVSNLIREGKTFQIPSIMQTSRALGNVLLNAALLELVEKKLVEPEEAYLRAIDKSNLVSAFEKNGIKTDFLKKEQKKELQPA